MKEIMIDGCKCTCESASILVPEVTKTPNALVVILVVIITFLIIVGLFLGFKKLQGPDEEETDFDTNTYY